jgi:hypothetical protein
MARGFKNPEEFSALVGWELYQVTFDKYHVMFYFNNGWAFLNVAFKFAVRAPHSESHYPYELYGTTKLANIDPLLQQRIVRFTVASIERLDVEFENGFVLEVYDDPETCSWWAWGGQTEADWVSQKNCVGDSEPDLMSEEGIAQRIAELMGSE